MGKYIGELNKATTKYGTCLDFSYSDTDLSEIDIKIEARDRQKKELEEYKLDWGEHTSEDYSLLQYDFYELTDGMTLTKPQEMLYRDLCLARLAKRNAEKDPTADTKNIQAQILTLMKTLKIDNFSENKELSVVERMLETRIAIQEKEKPAFYYEDFKKNQDYLGRGKYFYDHIYRPFKNVLLGSKLYNIVPDDKDFVSDEDYENIMNNGSERKEG